MIAIEGRLILSRLPTTTATSAAVTAVLSVVALALVVTYLTDAEKEPPATPLTEDPPGAQVIGFEPYRGSLPPDMDTSVWVSPSDVVARVRVEGLGASRWNAEGEGAPLAPGAGEVRFIYTPVQVQVQEYIKGTGPDELSLVQLGGVVGDAEMFGESGTELFEGVEAIVFLNAPGANGPGWAINTVYVIDGASAMSEADGRELPVADLLPMLREAALADAADTAD